MALTINKGITLTPPVIGRITMGHTVVKGEGKTLPVKDDHFSLTTLVQNKTTREWGVHDLQKVHGKGSAKLRAIPVTIAYNDVNLNLNNSFSAFDPKKGRVLCTGNGDRARRVTDEGVKEIDCPRPEACKYGQDARCKNMSRAYFKVDGQEDELGVFILRTTSFNSLNYLGTRLGQLSALTGGCMAGVPMMLIMESKTTAQSFREPFHYADLVTRPGMTLFDAVKQGRDYQLAVTEAGLSLEGMEEVLRGGLANSDFADDIEDMNEWFSDDDLVAAAAAASGQGQQSESGGASSLTERLRLAVASKMEAAPAAAVLEVAANEAPAEAPQEPVAAVA